MKLKHFKELDGVRAIAALMIMFFHFFQNLETNNHVLILVKKYAVFGQTGVSLFFVLSGFLITRILLNTKESTSYFINFYVRRALRIFPLYYLFLIIYYLVIPVVFKTPPIPFSQEIYYWIYLQNVATTFKWPANGPGHFWSLAVEEHFYLFWPVFIKFLSNKNIKIAVLLLVVIACLTRIILIDHHLEVFYFTFSRVDELAIGALLAVWEREGKLDTENSFRFIVLFISVVVPTFALWTLTIGSGIEIIQISKFVLLAFCYFSLIGLLITLKQSNWVKIFLKFNVLSYTGKISYGLYVYHPLCFLLVDRYLKVNSVFISFIISFVASYLIASISYYFFEVKFLSLKKKYSYN